MTQDLRAAISYIFYKPGPRIRSQVNDGRFPFCFLQELAIFVNDDLESDLS